MVGEVVEQSEERGSAANGGRHSQEAEMRRKRKPDETEATQVLTPLPAKSRNSVEGKQTSIQNCLLSFLLPSSVSSSLRMGTFLTATSRCVQL